MDHAPKFHFNIILQIIFTYSLIYFNVIIVLLLIELQLFNITVELSLLRIIIMTGNYNLKSSKTLQILLSDR